MKTIQCKICVDEKREIEATRVCKTCEVPEPLCDDCAKKHTKQKAIRAGEMHLFVDLENIKPYQKMSIQ